MKIGKFAEFNDVSKDTIRHYMDMGLINPEKVGGQYEFEDNCQESFDEVIDLKEMRFTLNEIKTSILFHRFGKLSVYQEAESYRTLFLNKYETTLNEIEKLIEVKDKLLDKIEEMTNEDRHEHHSIGIDIGAVHLFRCLKCGSKLRVVDGVVNDNQVMNGRLTCHCGESYIIDDGILMVGEVKRTSGDKYNADWISDYIENTDQSYLESIHETLEWVNKKIEFESFTDKVFMELGVGWGVFLRNIHNRLPDDSLYIAVDRSLRRLEFLKAIISGASCQKNILFICASFDAIPLKKESVDVLIDAQGSTDYNFHNSGYLCELVGPYVKSDAHLLSAYMLFEKFSTDSVIMASQRQYYLLDNIKESIKKSGYEVIDERIADSIDKGGKYDNYFVSGERVYNYICYAQKK